MNQRPTNNGRSISYLKEHKKLRHIIGLKSEVYITIVIVHRRIVYDRKNRNSKSNANRSEEETSLCTSYAIGFAGTKAPAGFFQEGGA